MFDKVKGLLDLPGKVLGWAVGEAKAVVDNARVFAYGLLVASLSVVGAWVHDGVVAFLPFLG